MSCTLVIDPERFADDEIHVEKEAYRHLFRARRLAVGDALRLVDGRGRARHAVVARVDRRRGVLDAGPPVATNEPAYDLRLLVALPRGERASWLVEKATEIGVSAVRFIASQRAPRQLGANALERLRRVATAAVEQSHRARRPEVSGVHGSDELEELLAGAADRFYLDPAAGAALARRSGPSSSGAVLIGPEGGFSEAERGRLAPLAEPAGLGARILRIETAAIAAAAQLLLPD